MEHVRAETNLQRRSDPTSQVIFLPYLGSFSAKILRFLPFVHQYPADEKLVCCERGEECFFPSATNFYFREGLSSIDAASLSTEWPTNSTNLFELEKELKARFPGHHLVRCQNYDARSKTGPVIKFALDVPRMLPDVDVALGVREPASRNAGLADWGALAAGLRSAGLRVAFVGAPDARFDQMGEVCSWAHPDGTIAGIVNIFRTCRLYIGAVNGLSHLAAFMDVPSLILGATSGAAADEVALMEKTNRTYFRRHLGSSISDDADADRSVMCYIALDGCPHERGSLPW